MHKQKQLFSEVEPPKNRAIEDQAYDMIGEMMLERETNQLLAELEEEKRNGTHAEMDEFFAQMNKRCEKQIYAYFRRQRLERFFVKTLPHMGGIAAALIATLALAGVGALAANETIRIEVMRLISSTSEKYTELKLVKDEEASFDVPAAWQGTSYLSYIPPGLELVSVENNPGFSTADYQWTESQKLGMFFDEMSQSTETNLDTEDALVTPVFINTYPGFMVEKGSDIHIYWSDEQKYFILTVRNMDRATAMKIAESVKKIR